MLAKRSSSCLSKLLCSTERSGSLRHPFGGQAFPRNVIDDVEKAQTPAAGELVVDKVRRPACIGPCLNEDRRSCSYGSSSRPPLAHTETFLPIEPVYAVDPRGLTALAQQNE
jgi:hypothetical protein